jgi:hypothetical protein
MTVWLPKMQLYVIELCNITEIVSSKNGRSLAALGPSLRLLSAVIMGVP